MECRRCGASRSSARFSSSRPSTAWLLEREHGPPRHVPDRRRRRGRGEVGRPEREHGARAGAPGSARSCSARSGGGRSETRRTRSSSTACAARSTPPTPPASAPIVAVYSFSGETPLSARDRAEFASYAAAIAREIPELRYISLGNEPNSTCSGCPSSGRAARTPPPPPTSSCSSSAYRTVKAADPRVTVIGGSLAARGSDNPRRGRARRTRRRRFIADLGAAFRASGLAKPPLDLFSIHPYPANSSIPPTAPDPHSTSIGIADYPRLVALLTGGLSAPPRRSSTASTASRPQIPRAELSLYSGSARAPRSGRSASSARPTTTSRRSAWPPASRSCGCCLLPRHRRVRSSPACRRVSTTRTTGPKRASGAVASSARAAENGQVRCS